MPVFNFDYEGVLRKKQMKFMRSKFSLDNNLQQNIFIAGQNFHYVWNIVKENILMLKFLFTRISCELLGL